MKKFKNYLTLNGASKRTIKIYTTNVKRMLKEIKGEINQEKLDDFFLGLKEQYSPEYFNSFISAISAYINFKKLDLNVPKRAKKDKKIPYAITKEYFEEELIKCAECVFKKPLRNKALLRFMFETGVRREDIMYTKRENFKLDENTAKIYVPKNRKERIVYFTDKTKSVLKQFFGLTAEKNNAFNIPSKTVINNIFDVLKEYLDNDKLHPHCFRHSYATILRKNGCPLEDIKNLMGLDSYQTVLRYAHIGTEDVKKKYKQYYK